MLAVTSPHKYHTQLNLCNTDTEGTERSVRIREVAMITYIMSPLRPH